MGWNLIVRVTGLVVVALLLLLLSEFVVKAEPAHTLLHEIGFAFIVSAVLWLVFELHLSNKSEKTWEGRIDNIIQNVFLGVLRKDLPKGLIDEVQRVILDAQFVRRQYRIEYRLKDATFAATPQTQSDCVEMVVRLSYKLTNITKQILPLELKITLPNPIHPALKTFNQVQSFKVFREGKEIALDLSQARAGFQKALKDDTTTEVPFVLPEIQIGPGHEISVEAEYAMAKEAEDSELLEMLYPGDGLEMTIDDRGVAGRRLVYARSVHRVGIEADVSAINPETKYLRIEDYVLPSQGVLVWWKRTPPAPATTLPSGQGGLHQAQKE
ncbi:hypothetical protein [Brevundimonas sp.]|uniref:hypothetical protein n=1 Tax=Brevundimonas sp. TaxID=1871086 RepID=UPI003F6FAD01